MVSRETASLRARLRIGAVISPLYFSRVDGRIRKQRHRALRQLMKSQWLPYGELLRLQEPRLEELFAAAAKTSWYAGRMGRRAAGKSAHDFLRRLPVLTHSELRDNLEALSVPPHMRRDAYENFSGGSTGAPIRVHQTPLYQAWGMAELSRDFTMCAGYRLGETRLFYWGSDVDSRAHVGIGGVLRDTLANQVWVNAFGSRYLRPDESDAFISEVRPRLVIGYVSTLFDVAQGLKVPPVGLRAVQTSAESLTSAQREVIERGFGVRAFNRYGCREVGNIAHECDDHSGLHTLMESNVVEVTDDWGRPLTQPGDEGIVTVTNLWNLATPLLRYQPGDIARVGEVSCACGRGSPKLETVLGRVSDVISAPSGRRIHGEFFTHLFYGAPVLRFQVEQTALTDLVVRVVPGEEYTDETRTRVTAVIHDHGDPSFLVDWRVVDDIAASASGKFRFTMSNVQ